MLVYKMNSHPLRDVLIPEELVHDDAFLLKCKLAFVVSARDITSKCENKNLMNLRFGLK